MESRLLQKTPLAPSGQEKRMEPLTLNRGVFSRQSSGFHSRRLVVDCTNIELPVRLKGSSFQSPSRTQQGKPYSNLVEYSTQYPEWQAN